MQVFPTLRFLEPEISAILENQLIAVNAMANFSTCQHSANVCSEYFGHDGIISEINYSYIYELTMLHFKTALCL